MEDNLSIRSYCYSLYTLQNLCKWWAVTDEPGLLLKSAQNLSANHSIDWSCWDTLERCPANLTRKQRRLHGVCQKEHRSTGIGRTHTIRHSILSMHAPSTCIVRRLTRFQLEKMKVKVSRTICIQNIARLLAQIYHNVRRFSFVLQLFHVLYEAIFIFYVNYFVWCTLSVTQRHEAVVNCNISNFIPYS